MLFAHFLLLAAFAAAYPPLRSSKRGGTFSGVATFNDYASQGTTNCGPKSGQGGAFGAAASDIAGDISGGLCTGSIDQSQCKGESPVSGYLAPACPKANCGKCYSVTNQGGMDGATVGGVGQSVVVQIIDACPATSALNFCKTIPANQRCGAPGVNQMDIDKGAYQGLTGAPYGGGPNLIIGIAEACCPGDSGCTPPVPSSNPPALSPAPMPQSAPVDSGPQKLAGTVKQAGAPKEDSALNEIADPPQDIPQIPPTKTDTPPASSAEPQGASSSSAVPPNKFGPFTNSTTGNGKTCDKKKKKGKRSRTVVKA